MITRIKTPMSESISKQFIELFCQYRKEGNEPALAQFKARYKLQEIIINLMAENPANIGIIQKAYENIKEDKSLLQKAITTYDLSLCSEEIQKKYMPLLKV